MLIVAGLGVAVVLIVALTGITLSNAVDLVNSVRDEKDPAVLLRVAKQLEEQGFDKTAETLRARATELTKKAAPQAPRLLPSPAGRPGAGRQVAGK